MKKFISSMCVLMATLAFAKDGDPVKKVKIENESVKQPKVTVTCSAKAIVPGTNSYITYTFEAGNWFSTAGGATTRCQRKLKKALNMEATDYTIQ